MGEESTSSNGQRIINTMKIDGINIDLEENNVSDCSIVFVYFIGQFQLDDVNNNKN